MAEILFETYELSRRLTERGISRELAEVLALLKLGERQEQTRAITALRDELCCHEYVSWSDRTRVNFPDTLEFCRKLTEHGVSRELAEALTRFVWGERKELARLIAAIREECGKCRNGCSVQQTRFEFLDTIEFSRKLTGYGFPRELAEVFAQLKLEDREELAGCIATMRGELRKREGICWSDELNPHSFDSLEYRKRLSQAGFTEEQAECIASMFAAQERAFHAEI